MRLSLGLGFDAVVLGQGKATPGVMSGQILGKATPSGMLGLAGGISGTGTLVGDFPNVGGGGSVFLAMDMSDFRNTYILGL